MKDYEELGGSTIVDIATEFILLAAMLSTIMTDTEFIHAVEGTMNWYKIQVMYGAQGYTFVGSSPDSVEELLEKVSRGEYLRLDDLLYREGGKIKDWQDWDNREVPIVHINPANIVSIQPYKGDPRSLPTPARPAAQS